MESGMEGGGLGPWHRRWHIDGYLTTGPGGGFGGLMPMDGMGRLGSLSTARWRHLLVIETSAAASTPTTLM